MSGMSSPATVHLQRSLEATLTPRERARLGVRLWSSMLAGGLLLVGVLLHAYGPPEQLAVAELSKALAALIVAAPLFFDAARGVLTRDAEAQSEQLVVLATLAALATGHFVTAALIPIIMTLGHFLEERSILGAQAAIEGLKSLQAHTATRLTSQPQGARGEAGEQQVDPRQLRVGDVIVVRPGEMIAADGEITRGQSTVDQSSITGEAHPREVAGGGSVYAGSTNLTGLIHVSVKAIGGDTAFGKVLDLLREAERSKTPVLKLIEQYAGYFVLSVLLIAGVTLFISRDLSRAIAVLVVGCPGPFILAGPTAMVAALATASRLGILIKNTKFMESLADADAVVLDKTGTVTLGELSVVEIRPLNNAAPNDLLRMARCCARASRHPVSQAIVRAAGDTGPNVAGASRRAPEATNDSDEHRAEELPGKGIVVYRELDTLCLGRREWLVERGLDPPDNPDHLGPVAWLAQQSYPTTIGAENERCNERKRSEVLGCFLLKDTPRPGAAKALATLRDLGFSRSVLLTGDRRDVAEQIGTVLRTDEIIADVLPEQKLEVVRAEKEAGRAVMVVGDGVNDALALAAGDVGVAMGAMGSDVALQSADVVLMTSDLMRLPMAVRLARQTRTIIHQNVLIGAGISVFMVALASYGVISPIAGAVLHNIGEVYVLINSARLLAFGR